MSTPKRRFNLLSLTFIVLCFKKSLLIRKLLNIVEKGITVWIVKRKENILTQKEIN